MKDGFDIDNPFFEFMGALADVVIVNILFLICSIPVITMGASVSAMYQTIQKMQEGRLSSVFRFFGQAFRSSFKISIPAWLFQLFSGCVLFFDLNFAGMMPKTLFWNIVEMVTGSLLLLWLMVSCYLLPAGIYAEKKIKEALAESLYMAVRNLPYTLVMAALNSIPAVCMMLGTYFIGVVTPIYIVAGFGVTAYLNVMLLVKCKGMHIHQA